MVLLSVVPRSGSTVGKRHGNSSEHVFRSFEISQGAVVPKCFEQYDRWYGSTGRIVSVVPIGLSKFVALRIWFRVWLN